MTSKLTQKLKQLPQKPGVYLYRNAGGDILYVGKAKNLRSRVRSYFHSSRLLAPRTQLLVAAIADLEYIICDTEAESLMLENTLIKKHQPHYNVLLRDDKNFQFIVIDYDFEIPQIYTVRKIQNKKKKESGPRIRYFGPYTSGTAVRQTLRLLRYILPYCANKKVGARPCFYSHLGRCPGVCNGKVSLEDYRTHMRSIERFLSGDFHQVIGELRGQMRAAAAGKKFEKAARLRDQMRALETMIEKQKVVSPARETHDAVGLYVAGSLAAATVLQIRSGKLVGRENFLLANAGDTPPADILQAFIENYYLQASDVPAEINLPTEPNDTNPIAALLRPRTGHRIMFSTPARGRKRKLVRLASINAADFLDTASQNLALEQAKATRALFELRGRLNLSEVPLRIECFDISNIQGTSAVGSMVVFENGKPAKHNYKRFAIKTLSTPNDVGMMREMLQRRFAHSGKPDPTWRHPDLIIVDGGLAQLNAALAVLRNKHLRVPVVGLAKRLEEIYRPRQKSPLRLPNDNPALHLLQRIRDEAHRFAISYHRAKRSRAMLAGKPLLKE